MPFQEKFRRILDFFLGVLVQLYHVKIQENYIFEDVFQNIALNKYYWNPIIKKPIHSASEFVNPSACISERQILKHLYQKTQVLKILFKETFLLARQILKRKICHMVSILEEKRYQVSFLSLELLPNFLETSRKQNRFFLKKINFYYH